MTSNFSGVRCLVASLILNSIPAIRFRRALLFAIAIACGIAIDCDYSFCAKHLARRARECRCRFRHRACSNHPASGAKFVRAFASTSRLSRVRLFRMRSAAGMIRLTAIATFFCDRAQASSESGYDCRFEAVAPVAFRKDGVANCAAIFRWRLQIVLEAIERRPFEDEHASRHRSLRFAELNYRQTAVGPFLQSSLVNIDPLCGSVFERQRYIRTGGIIPCASERRGHYS